MFNSINIVYVIVHSTTPLSMIHSCVLGVMNKAVIKLVQTPADIPISNKVKPDVFFSNETLIIPIREVGTL